MPDSTLENLNIVQVAGNHTTRKGLMSARINEFEISITKEGGMKGDSRNYQPV